MDGEKVHFFVWVLFVQRAREDGRDGGGIVPT